MWQLLVRPELWKYKSLTINDKIFGPTKVGVVRLAIGSSWALKMWGFDHKWQDFWSDQGRSGRTGSAGLGTSSIKRSAVYFTFLTSILIPQHALINFVELYCGILLESFGYFGSLRTGFHRKADVFDRWWCVFDGSFGSLRENFFYLSDPSRWGRWSHWGIWSRLWLMFPLGRLGIS